MKRIFTMIFAVAIAFATDAQQKHFANGAKHRKVSPRAATEDEKRMALENGAQGLEQAALQQRGDALFTEDFANGFDGNNAFGPWSSEDSGNNSIWMVADDNSPGGFYSDAATEALESATAANGWMIFDCDLYQDGEISATNPAEDVTGYLTSPVMNLSSSGSAILEFQQTFRYCCFDDRPIFVEVTNDGGLNWYVFDGAPDFTGGANDMADNPYVTTIDISGVAAGQSSVQFRFAWQPNGTSTHSHYFWGVDDVAIYENPVADDVAVMTCLNGDIFSDFQFRAIPLEQAIPSADGGVIVGTIYTNLGTNAHASNILVEILDENMNVLDSDSLDVEILPIALQPNPTDPLDTVYVATGWEPTATGTYYTRTTVRFPETDITPNDNTAMRKFFITEDEFGHDDPALIDAEMVPLAGTGTSASPFPPTGYGSYITCYNDGSNAYGMTVRFDNGTDTGTPITVLLIKRGEDYNLTDGEFITGAEYLVDGDWTPSGSQSYPYYLPFESPGELEGGFNYFVGLQTIDEGTDELSIQAIAEKDEDFSTGIWAETTEGDFIWFFGLGTLTDFTPSVRLILSEWTGVENLEQIGLNDFTIYPNPAVGTANLGFNLQGSHFIAYEVRDITGKLMDWKNIGQFSGNNNYSLDVSAYPAGNYVVNLVVDGEHMITRQLNVTK